MRVLWKISVVVVGVTISLLVLIGALLVLENPSNAERENYWRFKRLGLGDKTFTVHAIRPGIWDRACVAGEYTDHREGDFEGDIFRASSWAIVLYGPGGQFTWLMNERLLRYRNEEDQAYGWCFDPRRPLRLMDGKFLDIPGREEVLANG